jgi:hypothetical protein
MTDRICPFSATLARDDFACHRATQVIRRGGVEFACQSEQAHTRCRQLFELSKQAALPAFGVEDDLTQMPQSVLVKIQFGSLLGLQRIMGDQAPGSNRIEDIDSLVADCISHYADLGLVPFDQLVADITGWKLSRRRRR